MKYISIDIETLGFCPDTCDVIEFGGVIDDLSNPKPFDQCPKLRVFFHKDLYQGQAGALAMHSGIFKEMNNYDGTQGDFLNQVHKCRFEDFGKLFREWHFAAGIEETPTAAGKNLGAFDMMWLRKAIHVRHRILDVGSLFFNPKKDKTLPNLQNCLQRCGITKSIDHTSVADAWDVIECIRHYYGVKTNG